MNPVAMHIINSQKEIGHAGYHTNYPFLSHALSVEIKGLGKYCLITLYETKPTTRGAGAPVSLHRPDISTMAEEVFNNYHSIPAF